MLLRNLTARLKRQVFNLDVLLNVNMMCLFTASIQIEVFNISVA